MDTHLATWLPQTKPTRLTRTERRLAETRTRIQLLDAERRLVRMERQLKESATLPDFWVADYGDFGNSQVDSWLPYMAGNVGRRHGANYPFFLNLQQHGFLRDFSRLIVGQNMFAQGMLEALTSFIVGEGITWTVQQKANT